MKELFLELDLQGEGASEVKATAEELIMLSHLVWKVSSSSSPLVFQLSMGVHVGSLGLQTKIEVVNLALRTS